MFDEQGVIQNSLYLEQKYVLPSRCSIAEKQTEIHCNRRCRTLKSLKVHVQLTEEEKGAIMHKYLLSISGSVLGYLCKKFCLIHVSQVSYHPIMSGETYPLPPRI